MPNSHPPSFTAGGNWLITSASAKVDLARRMREALNSCGLRLFTTDRSDLSAAFHFSDGHFLLPSLGADDFLNQLMETCLARNIRVILPTRDADLRFFASHREPLEKAGLWPLVSDKQTVDICLDKIQFDDHCRHHHLPVLPRIHEPTPSDYPCFVRSRIGSAGHGAQRIPHADAMRLAYGPPPWPDLLIQPCCEDREYTIDALFDLDGHAVQWISRERLRVKAGESTVGRTVSIPAIDDLMPRLARSFHFKGPATIQVFHSEQMGPHLIEVNPRLGGAAALGIEAGMDTPRRLVSLAQGDTASFLRPRTLQFGITMLRYSQDIFIHENTTTPT